MAYLVTGATGFIGRFLVKRLLEDRTGDIHVLVREGSEGKAKRLGRSKRIKPVRGDLGEPGLGIDPKWIEEHKGTIDHMFHLAAIYDMTADEERNETLNNGGTRHAVEVANALEVGHLHHTSSVAAAGLYKGTFTEDMFDEGQDLDHPYHRTKFESERIAREESDVPWRVYRPAMVLGHSQTGEMDKVDGPYYLFKTIKLSAKLPAAASRSRPAAGRHERRAGRLRRRRDGPHRPRARPRRPAPSTSSTPSRSRPSTSSTPSRRSPARRAARPILPKVGAGRRAQGARRRPAARRPRHPAAGARLRGLHRHVRHRR